MLLDKRLNNVLHFVQACVVVQLISCIR